MKTKPYIQIIPGMRIKPYFGNTIQKSTTRKKSLYHKHVELIGPRALPILGEYPRGPSIYGPLSYCIPAIIYASTLQATKVPLKISLKHKELLLEEYLVRLTMRLTKPLFNRLFTQIEKEYPVHSLQHQLFRELAKQVYMSILIRKYIVQAIFTLKKFLVSWVLKKIFFDSWTGRYQSKT